MSQLMVFVVARVPLIPAVITCVLAVSLVTSYSTVVVFPVALISESSYVQVNLRMVSARNVQTDFLLTLLECASCVRSLTVPRARTVGVRAQVVRRASSLTVQVRANCADIIVLSALLNMTAPSAAQMHKN